MNSSVPQTWLMAESLRLFLWQVLNWNWLQRSIKAAQQLAVIRKNLVLFQSREEGTGWCATVPGLSPQLSGVYEPYSFLEAQLTFYFLTGIFPYPLNVSKIKVLIPFFSSEFPFSSLLLLERELTLSLGIFYLLATTLWIRQGYRAIFIYLGIYANPLSQCLIYRICSIHDCGGKNDTEQNIGERRNGSKMEVMPCSNTTSSPSPTPFLFFPILQSTSLRIHFILK